MIRRRRGHDNGGFVNVYAIGVLARRGYLTMTPRGLPASPARTSLGQRSLELPTILVTKQHSLSDTEDFTEGWLAADPEPPDRVMRRGMSTVAP